MTTIIAFFINFLQFAVTDILFSLLNLTHTFIFNYVINVTFNFD